VTDGQKLARRRQQHGQLIGAEVDRHHAPRSLGHRIARDLAGHGDGSPMPLPCHGAGQQQSKREDGPRQPHAPLTIWN
jgi:hypothetical protein